MHLGHRCTWGVCVRVYWVCVCEGKHVPASSVGALCGFGPSPWPEHFIPGEGCWPSWGATPEGPLLPCPSPSSHQHLQVFGK